MIHPHNASAIKVCRHILPSSYCRLHRFPHSSHKHRLQYIPRNMHTVFALLCFVVVILWLIFPYPSGLLHWHCGNLTIAPMPAKQPWWIWINTSCEFIMNDYITTTKQSTTKPCGYFLGYTVCFHIMSPRNLKKLVVVITRYGSPNFQCYDILHRTNHWMSWERPHKHSIHMNVHTFWYTFGL